MCKGSCRRKPTEGLFFATLQPLRGFRTPLGDACKRASHTRKSNPSRRGLQACSAYLQIPCVKGAPPKAVRDCFFTTRLGDACKCASHTRKSLQPLRGFRTRLGDACKHAAHTCKSLLEKAILKICISSPITEASFTFFSSRRKEGYSSVSPLASLL